MHELHEPNVLLLPGRTATPSSWSPRALLTILFRRKRVFMLAFFAVLAPVVLAILVLPPDYESQTKILIERRRFDPVITSSVERQGAGADMSQLARLDEQDIDSEIDLLTSNDVLQQVVEKCGLWDQSPAWRKLIPIPHGPKPERVAKAVARLRKELHVEPPNKSNIVTVSYQSHDPQQAAKVLQVLSQAYVEKHLDVHRPAGGTEFFAKEVDKNRQALQDAEAKLAAFTQQQGVVSADQESKTLLDKISAFDASLHNTQAQIAADEQKMQNLQQQLKHAAPRIVTSVKTSSTLMENLKSNLYNLELKRSELLTKYQPTYRLVQDVDKQIADTKAAIADAEKNLTSEQTTDQDPVYAWIKSQMAQVSSELASLRASERDTQKTLAEYKARSVQLEGLGNQQADLLRTEKAADDTYMESMRKQSEARLSEALDRSRITNVEVAEAAAVPVLPTMSWYVKLALGFALALFVGLASAFVADYWDPSFRTPLEVESVLDLPVLAAIPYPGALEGEVSRSSNYPLAG
jgi:uncharacterized protein involved in exopolysaccharide biosynthesis